MGIVTENRVKAVARLVAGLVFIATVALIAMGVVDASMLEAAVASVLAIAGLVLAWWKDNNVTVRAIARHMLNIQDPEEIVEEGEDD